MAAQGEDCRSIADPARRLACYDARENGAAPAPAQLGTAPVDGTAAPVERQAYAAPGSFDLNQWALTGNWTVGKEKARAENRATASSPIFETGYVGQ